METILAPLLLIVGLAAGAGAAWWLRGRELAGEREHAAALAATEREAHEERITALLTLRGEFEQTVKGLAADALDGSQRSFLQLAEQVFARHKEGAEKTLADRQKEISALLAPINKSLEDYKAGLGEIEKARAAAYGGLSEEMRSLVLMQADASAQTRKLVNALQAAPKTRGRWGEHQLHNVMELSGMAPYVDFIPEQTIAGDDGRLRPDVIIRLPGDRRIVVDAKTSMAAYLDAVEAADDETREGHLVHHARQLRTHMRLLAAKQYWDALPCTPDFVAMFIPGENFYAAAIERDPQLFEDAIESKVLIVTPTTLIALAKAIAVGWRQEKLAENARHIGELGRELYRRLATMGDHAGRLGAGLDTAVKHYNNFVGSLEGRVMVQARKFSELDVEGTQEPLPELKPVETQTRSLRADTESGAREAEIIALVPSAAAAERSQP
ncbi:MAG TPA: DNA recombination protein RmuC [Stellaceae bacterium]|nr:DNA recombination protein RmuC [Stellaceae bacterium]